MAPLASGRTAVHPDTNTASSSFRGTQTEILRQATPVGTLRLRGEPAPRQPRIRWAEDVIDNEGLGRKSSKVCCIYHRPREVGESSSEDDSSSSGSSGSDSDSDIDTGKARMGGKGKARRVAHNHAKDHGHDHDCNDHAEDAIPGSDGRDGSNQTSKPKATKRKAKNAYEKMPKYRGKSTLTEVKR